MPNNESKVIQSIQGLRIEEKRGNERGAKKMKEYNIQFYLVTYFLFGQNLPLGIKISILDVKYLKK